MIGEELLSTNRRKKGEGGSDLFFILDYAFLCPTGI